MTTITIFDGNNTIEVEVEDEFALTYKAMAKRDELDERRETRRHQSLNASIDNGFDFKDERVDIEGDSIAQDEMMKALSVLSKEQQELITKIYYEGFTLTEVARTRGVSQAAVGQQMKRALAQLKKYFEEI